MAWCVPDNMAWTRWQYRARTTRTWQAFNAAINAVLARYPIDLVVLAGFLSLYNPPPALAGAGHQYPSGPAPGLWRHRGFMVTACTVRCSKPGEGEWLYGPLCRCLL